MKLNLKSPCSRPASNWIPFLPLLLFFYCQLSRDRRVKKPEKPEQAFQVNTKRLGERFHSFSVEWNTLRSETFVWTSKPTFLSGRMYDEVMWTSCSSYKKICEIESGLLQEFLFIRLSLCVRGWLSTNRHHNM